MAVFVTLSTTLRSHVPGYDPVAGLTLDLPPAADAAALAQTLGLPLDAVKVVMVNGRRAPLAAPLADGDRVAYFPAVGGG